MTPVVYSAQTLTGALIGTCFFSLIAGFASGFWFSQRLRSPTYPDPPEQRQQLNRLTETSESPGFNNKSINLVLNVPPKNPNGKNANSSAENKPMQKVKKTYIWYQHRNQAVWGLPPEPKGSPVKNYNTNNSRSLTSSASASSICSGSEDRCSDQYDPEPPIPCTISGSSSENTVALSASDRRHRQPESLSNYRLTSNPGHNEEDYYHQVGPGAYDRYVPIPPPRHPPPPIPQQPQMDRGGGLSMFNPQLLANDYEDVMTRYSVGVNQGFTYPAGDYDEYQEIVEPQAVGRPGNSPRPFGTYDERQNSKVGLRNRRNDLGYDDSTARAHS